VTQQARHLVWKLEETEPSFKFLIRDRDAKYTPAFNAVFSSEGIKIVKTPIRAPKANAFAERWVRTVREECLDRILVLNQVHLERVLREYETYYNQARPHQGIAQRIPIPFRIEPGGEHIECHAVLGGLIHDYQRVA
jgi:transposase InsO family protein